jgi:arylsulfatase A-like enzyme
LPLITPAIIAASDARHRAMVETLQEADRQIGQIIAQLKESGRWQNTLLIFLSDNGLMWGEHRLVDSKGCVYEECIRVPMWVRAPGLVARHDTSLVANIDIAPTIAAWAGITPTSKVNGANLLGLLRNPGAPWRTEILNEELGNPTSSQNYSAVRTQRYIYVEYANLNKELYDLATDPYQLTNVAAVKSYASILSSLKSRLGVLKKQ